MGSLHCAGMCGPLVLMTPVVGSTRQSFLASRLLYHAGRILIYMVIGVVFGLIGESIVFAGFQRWLSIAVGVSMILALFFGRFLKAKLWRIPALAKSLIGGSLRKNSYQSVFALGAANGLLPCGLVYMAATASAATGSARHAAFAMFLFGLGNVPMLLAISMAGKRFNFSARPWLQKLAPVAVAAVALLLILRSDPISLLQGAAGPAHCPACARVAN
jgi:sulfite exporter TauE/SafE